MTKQEADKRAYEIVKKLFKNDKGEPFEMTQGQIDLFRSIYEKQHPRLQFECYTQYGKSDVVSMAVLLRASTFPEKWIILGGTKDKAEIIMGKLIKHIFENSYTLGKFQIGKDESIERIKRERSKERVTFRIDDTGIIGEVIILSAETRRKGEDAGDILIGHGGQNLIEDDAALIPDKIHGKAMRMLGGHKDNFLLKITNTIGRNHAYKSSIIKKHDDLKEKRPSQYISDAGYKVINIDYVQGMSEGRILPEFINEMRGVLDYVMFGMLYECLYPPAEMVDDKGWMPLLIEEDIEEAQKRRVDAVGRKRLGIDVAEGINFNAFVIRQDNIARVKEKSLEKDPMKTAERGIAIATEERVMPQYSFIDSTGLGSGIYARMRQLDFSVVGVEFGAKVEKTEEELKIDPTRYFNLRAKLYWSARTWIRAGGALEPHSDWIQLSKVRYRIVGDKMIQIMPKEEMRVRGLIQATESTDIPDAFVETFADPGEEVFVMPEQSQPLETHVYYPELGI